MTLSPEAREWRDRWRRKNSPWARHLNPWNYLDRLQRLNRNDYYRAHTQATQKHAKERVAVDRSPNKTKRYSINITFSDDDGDSFSERLAVHGSRNYLVRLTITQHTSDILVAGYKIEWHKPDGWPWLDGLGGNTWEEAVCNPLEVTRIIRTPGVVTGTSRKFKCIIRKEYTVW